MIIPELKSLSLLDDTANTSDDFWIIAKAYIGEKGGDGADEFMFYVTSPKRLHKICMHGGEFGRGLIIMNEFGEEEVKKKINKLLDQCTKPTWQDIAIYLGRFAYWEYEDIRDISEI